MLQTATRCGILQWPRDRQNFDLVAFIARPAGEVLVSLPAY
jgi:hypothetical protein